MIVQKFGGVAMKNESMRAHCIMHIKNGIAQFKKVVVVVSAMGRLGSPYATNTLLNLTQAFEHDDAAKDLVASCGELIAASILSAELRQAGVGTKILHGTQAGIFTDENFGNAKIIKMDMTTLLKHMDEVDCVIVPGFQGIDRQGNVLTLGRGGSDLTAVALGSALQANHVEFFKDVPGVFSENPHLTSNYKKLDKLSHEEFIQLLRDPSPIIQLRAALYAQKKVTPLYIRGITGNESGTWILSD